MVKIQVIVGSTRPGRQTDKLAKWVAKEATTTTGLTVELVDLRDYDLPLFDEAVSPQYNPNRTPNPAAKKWLEKLGEADGFILVTPEYNRSTSGVLKNALDYIDFQFQRKPVLLVAHGSSGGGQAVGHLRGIIPGLLAVTVPNAVYFKDRVADSVSEEGELAEELQTNPQGPKNALHNALAELEWYTSALAAARRNS
jgi:NAD(P)H-dependent FMN reductase